MNFSKLTKAMLAPAAMSMAVLAAPAQAAILVDNWSIDLGAAFGDNSYGKIVGLDELTFKGMFAAVPTDNAPAGPSIGDIVTSTFVLNVTSCNGAPDLCDSTTGKRLGSFGLSPNFYELTGVGTTTQRVTGFGAGGVVVFEILGGSLSIFADSTPDARVNLSGPNPGSGMTDGTLIATFAAIAGEGGASFNPAALNGQQDVTFGLTFAAAGVLEDQFGNDLELGSLLGITDANTDSDPENDGLNNTTISNGPLAAICTAGNLGLGVRCGTEDGSFVLANNVPEPTSLAVLGAGLLALGGSRRLRKRG